MRARVLAPLAVLLLLGGVGWRWSQRPGRALARERLWAALERGDRVDEDLARYRARHAGPEDHWLIAKILLRTNGFGEAVDLIFGTDAGGAPRPEAVARFAQEALEAVGWRDVGRQNPSPHAARVLVVLLEAKVPWATSYLRDVLESADIAETTGYLYPAYRWSSRGAREALAVALRTLADRPVLLAAAALISGGPGFAAPVPEDADRLVEAIESEVWRNEYANAWSVACLALGRVDAARAMSVLPKVAEHLGQSAREPDRQLALMAQVGLLAAGDWTQWAALRPVILPEDRRPFAGVVSTWTAEALLHRHRAGDPQARKAIREVWEEVGPRQLDLRWRIAHALLLEDEAPAEGVENAIPQILGPLERPGAPLRGRTIAGAARYRLGQEGSARRLLQVARLASESLDQQGSETLVAALRALLLYSRP